MAPQPEQYFACILSMLQLHEPTLSGEKLSAAVAYRHCGSNGPGVVAEIPKAFD